MRVRLYEKTHVRAYFRVTLQDATQIFKKKTLINEKKSFKI